MNKLIDLLQQQHLVWQGANKTPAQAGCSTGYDELDERLEGGFPKGVIEIQSDHGIGELRLLLPVLKSASVEERLIVFIAPFGVVSSQALAAQGIALDKVVVVYPSKQQEALWAAEQCLRSGACHSVVMWLEQPLEVHQVKRLQTASKAGNSQQFILRIDKAESLSLPFDLSLLLQPHAQGLSARINKRKGGWPSENFTVNMAKYWPMLVQQPRPDNLVQFPKISVG